MNFKLKLAGLVVLAIVVTIIFNWKSVPLFDYDFQDPSLTFEERVDDLVSRMTLEEKVSQMLNASPSIERLGIPAYNWWNECLHGVGRSGVNVTVFPQAIAMASTFNDEALLQMAQITSTEARAIYNEEKKSGREGTQYRGLTFWTPNINIFRDPRWGRGQETYGEDPYLTSQMGSAMVRGLQGDNPKYLKASACAKHFAVHSGPEAKRHEFDISVSDNDLWNTYLPAFEKLVVDDNVSSVMCAYNRFQGEPCCGNNRLMLNILRGQWGFEGYVTSDCGAIDDFYLRHKTYDNAVDASVGAVLAGTDLECGEKTYRSLIEAVNTGKISEEEIDVSVKRLFMIRMRLGMFDPDSVVPYSRVSMQEVEQPSHHEHSLKMARESMVLLKNANNTLPLKKNLRKIAVVGPNANSEKALLANYNGFPTDIVTALEGIQAKVSPTTEIIYEPACGYEEALRYKTIDLLKSFKAEGINGWKASYFENPTLSGSPKNMALTEKINFSLDQSNDIIPDIKAENISVRYTTTFTPEKADTYIFEISGDDGFRMYVNNQKLIDEWYDHGLVTKSCTFHATPDSSYRITIEYYQGSGSATFNLVTGVKSDNSPAALVRKVKDADAIIFVGGISCEIEEEDNDRTDIDLPAVQTEFMKSLKATGKPVIFVLYTGSPLSINWENQNIPAIINAWYGGQDAGTAIADIIFGDYNPAGRLPVTFYKGVNDLPGFEDYSMSNRTYRYFKGDVLYPFGYGLSYTTFNYSWNLQPESTYQAGDTIKFSVDIKNTGKYDGDEVLQVYSAYPENPELPVKELRYFKRIGITKGETQKVEISIPVDQLKKWSSEKSSYTIFPGEYQLLIGSSSTNHQLTQTITIH